MSGFETYQYLPLFAKLAIERLDSDSTLRTSAVLNELIDAYAKTYNQTCDQATRESAHYICSRRFAGSFISEPFGVNTMSSRKPSDQATYQAELQFILTAWDNERSAFSNDRACFENYVRMQARFAWLDGFPGIGQQIADVLTSAGISFKSLSPAEETKFRAWATTNYKPFSEIDPVWHPVARDECARINQATLNAASAKTFVITLDAHDSDESKFIKFLRANDISMTGETPFDVAFRAPTIAALVGMIQRFYDTGHTDDFLTLVSQIRLE